MTRKIPLALAVILILLTLWAPLPFASITRGGQVIVQSVAFLALALACFCDLRSIRRTMVPAMAIAGVGLIGLLQSLRWPVEWVERVSPQHADLYAKAARLAGLRLDPALSLAPSASRAAALTWLAVAAAAVASSVAGTPWRHRRALLGAVLAGGLIQVLLGLRGLFADASTIWNVEVGATAGRLRGTFVNPDHAALYLEMTLAVAFAWCWLATHRHGLVPPRTDPVPWLRGVLPPLLLWLVLFVGLAFTGSRAGLVGAAFGVLAQGLFLALLRRRRRAGTIGPVMLLLGLVFVATVSVEQGLGRFMTSASLDAPWDKSRVRAYRLSLDLWNDYRWTGTGLATFRDAFPRVQTPDLEGSWWHAHSNVIELLVTTGILGASILGLGFLWCLVRLIFDLRDRQAGEDKAVSLAALGLLASVGLHEAVDFGLCMPANAITLAVVCGAALAQTDTR